MSTAVNWKILPIVIIGGRFPGCLGMTQGAFIGTLRYLVGWIHSLFIFFSMAFKSCIGGVAIIPFVTSETVV